METDCGICNITIAGIVLLVSIAFFKWSQQNEKAVMDASEVDSDSASAKDSAKKAKKKAKNKAKKDAKKEKAAAAASEAAKEEPVVAEEPEEEAAPAEEPKKSKKKKNKKSAAAAATPAESKKPEAPKAEEKPKEQPKADKKKKKAAAKIVDDNDAAWETVKEVGSKITAEVTIEKTITKKPKAAKPVVNKVSPDDYLKNLPEEIRQQILQQNSIAAQKQQEAKANKPSEEWQDAPADSKKDFSNKPKKSSAVQEVDDTPVPTGRVETKKVFLASDSSLWQDMHAKTEAPKIALTTGLIDYSWE